MKVVVMVGDSGGLLMCNALISENERLDLLLVGFVFGCVSEWDC